MRIVISGLSEDACNQAFSPVHSTIKASWVPPSEFGQVTLDAMSAIQTDVLLWVYLPPWIALSRSLTAASAEPFALQDWLTQQRSVLQLRSRFGLRLILINAERVHSAMLEAYLLGQEKVDADFSMQSLGSSDSLAKLFAWAAPDCWDTFETLEAASWLPNGSPQFRDMLETSDEAALIGLMNCMHEGALVPTLRSELYETGEQLQAARKILQNTDALLQKLEDSVAASANERHALVTEKETLARQLSQVQAQLNDVRLRTQGEILQLAREKEATSAARVDDAEKVSKISGLLAVTRQQMEESQRANAVLVQDKNALEAAIRTHVADGGAVATERNQLLEQLNLLQHELEALHLDSHENAARLKMEKTKHAAEQASNASKLTETTKRLAAAESKTTQNQRARDAATAQQKQSAAKLIEVKNSLADAQDEVKALQQANQQLSDKLLEQQKILAVTQTQGKASTHNLTEQNLLMQRQLHQIQGELERYYLVNREMQSVMANSAQTMHRARGMVTNILLND